MPRRFFYMLLSGLLLAPLLPARPQEKQKPPSQDAKQPATADTSQTPAQDASGPDYNPFNAAKDMEVGTFYMHKGDLDAAIERFRDAIRLRANFAKPRLLIAQIYEKKGEDDNAVKYYEEYLKVLPGAPDAKKVRQKIDKLKTR